MRTADPSAHGRRSAAIFVTVELPSAGAYRLAASGAIRYALYTLYFAYSSQSQVIKWQPKIKLRIKRWEKNICQKTHICHCARATRYYSYGTVSVTSRCSVETHGRIELVFGTETSGIYKTVVGLLLLSGTLSLTLDLEHFATARRSSRR